LACSVRSHEADAVAALDAGRKALDDHHVTETLLDVLRLDDQLAGLVRIRRRHGCETLRPFALAVLHAHRLQLAETAHVALAPGGHAIAQPVLLANDLATELEVLLFLFLEDLVAP